MIQPFYVTDHLMKLKEPYPDTSLLRDAANEGRFSREAIARLWLSEGIPYAFKRSPALYEEVRRWLGQQLDISPKQISLIGSARLGASLAPKKFGRKFDSSSDLDLLSVCEHLFYEVVEDFGRWKRDYESKSVMPKNDKEREYWNANLEVCHRNINRGFVDTTKIPNRKRYSVSTHVSNRMWVLIEKLSKTTGAPNPGKASLRCYESWDRAIAQISLSLRDI